MDADLRREGQLEAELELVRDELARAQQRLQEQVRLAKVNALQRDVLLSIAQMAANGRPFEETLQSLVQYAAALSGAEGAAFGRVFGSDESMEFVAVWGHYDPLLGERINLAGSWTQEVLRTGVSALYDDHNPDPRADLDLIMRFATRSVMVVPLRVKGQTVGVLWVSNHSPASACFQAEDIAFLEAFANQAGLVLSEGLAHTELGRRVRQLSALKELGLALFQADQRENLLDLTMDRVVQVLDVPMCFIVEADWPAGAYREVRRLGVDPRLLGEIPIDGSTITGRTLLTGRPQHYHHRPQLPGFERLGIECIYSSFLSVPLPGANRPAGAVTVGALSSHRFDEDDLQFLQTVASYLTVALTQAQRLDRLSHELEQLDAVIEQVGDPVVVADMDLTVVRANQVVRAMSGVQDPFGLPLGELLRRLDARTDSGTAITSAHEALDGVRQGQRTKGLLLQVTLRDGSTRWLNTTMTPISDSAGTIRYMVGVGQDVTEQRLMERAKDEFLSVVSHELKTPLTAIKGFAQLLSKQAEKMGAPVSMQRALALIDQESNRMTGLVNELLDVSRIQLGRLQLMLAPMDAVALARHVVERVQRDAPRHQVRLVLPAEPVEGLWDKARLEQVLLNLLDNAVKYQPAGGPVELSVQRTGDRLRVEVRDQGVGIDPTVKALLGRRFYRPGELHEQVAGMGLGLHISAEIIRLHGGEINVSSEPGEGSCFWFELPLGA